VLLRFAILIALRRTAADWRLQAAAGLGMVLAVALMASAVIYSNALRETALRHTLQNASVGEVNLAVGLAHALERPTFEATRRSVQGQVNDPIDAYLKGSAVLAQTSTFLFSGLPQLDLPREQQPRGPVHGVTDLAENVRLIQGRLPQVAEGELEVVIDPLGSALLQLPIGQQFGVAPPEGGATRGDPFPVRVVGIVEPLDPSDPYWQLGFPVRSTQRGRDWVTLPLYTDLDNIFDTLGATYPGLYTTYYWLFFVDVEAVRSSDASPLQNTLVSARRQFFNTWPAPSWETDLGGLLARYDFLLTLARIPLFLLAFLAVGVLLYYLFLIAGLMGRLRAPEIALFRSRGASMPQVGLVVLTEGVLLAIPAIVIGPFLAQALVISTGKLFPAASGGAGLVFVDLSVPVFLLGGAAALLGVVVLTATTLTTARHGTVEFRRAAARPPQLPLLHRYYIDLVLLALIGMLWWQLKSRGSFLVQSLGEQGLELDMTLLLGPVLGVVAVGLLLFRLFPLSVRAVAWAADPIAPIWLAHGLRRIARDPVPAGSILVLLALATSLGVLASTITATLERNQKERGLYEAGATLRITHSLGGNVVEGHSVAQALRSLPGATDATDVLRVGGLAGGTTLLAVDAATFPRVVWSRDDFTHEPLDQIIGTLMQTDTTPSGTGLPADTTHLGVWVETGRRSEALRLLARLQDSRGVYFDMEVGDLSGQGWRYLEGPIEPFFRGQRFRTGAREDIPTFTPTPPYTLHTLWVTTAGGGSSTGALFLDQLQAITPDGPVEVASFQDLAGWYALEDASSPGLYALELSESVARPGRRSAAFSWGGGGTSRRGIRTGPAETPLPAVVSPSFLTDYQVQMGDRLPVEVQQIFVPVEIVDVAEFLSTLDPLERPFIVIDLNSALEYVALRAPRRVDPDMEVWLSAGKGTLSAAPALQAIEEMGGLVSEVYEAEELVASRTGDPLLTAGWLGLLALSFVTVVLASSSGLILYTYMDARERSQEFALLRTLGFSRPQVNGILWFNLVLVVLSGIAVGTWGGQWLGGALLPLLEVAEEGRRVTPPMVLATNWLALGVAYTVLAAATAATVMALAWAISHLDVQRLLRAGGD